MSSIVLRASILSFNRGQVVASLSLSINHLQRSAFSTDRASPQKRVRGLWTVQEDERLRDGIKEFGAGQWMKIVQKYFPGRTTVSVLKHWNQVLSPTVKIGPWTKEEDAKLLELIGKMGYKWTAIGALMDGRPGSQCCGRWNQYLRPEIHRGPWTEEEDKALLMLFKQHQQHPRKWIAISEAFPTKRSNFQLSKRHAALSEVRDGRKWTAAEDELLAQAIGQFGNRDWKRIAACLTNREADQCRTRWRRLMLLETKEELWTEEEDEQLRKGVALHGTNAWAAIAHTVTGRNGIQCRRRWNMSLYPKMNTSAWTAEEDEIILQYRARGVNVLRFMSKLPGRSSSSILLRCEEIKEQIKQRKENASTLQVDASTLQVDASNSNVDHSDVQA